MATSKSNQQTQKSLVEWVDSTPDEVAASLTLSESEVATVLRVSAKTLQRARNARNELIASMQTPDPSSLASIEFIRPAGVQAIVYPMLAVRRFLNSSK